MTNASEPARGVERGIGLVVVMLMIAAGGFRARALSESRSRPTEPEHIQTALASLTKTQDARQHLAAVGVTAKPLVFDSSAQVILSCGPDGKPGQAGFDDNYDRIADNPLELGAVGSDDLCLAPWQSLYDLVRQEEGTGIISLGSFIPVADAAVKGDRQHRWLISGDDWTWMVID